MAKMRPDERDRFLHERLAEQRHLLNKAIQGMAQGDLSEGLHIATIVRTLIHEGKGKPLLKQLSPSYLDLTIFDEKPSQPKEGPPGTESVVVLSVPIHFRITGEGYFLNPEIVPEKQELVILGRWWTRPSLIIPGAGGFSRKEIVLGIANKEGGAHVDPDVSRKYQQLLDYNSFQIGLGSRIEALNLSRLMVGQAGVEILDFLDRHFPAPDKKE